MTSTTTGLADPGPVAQPFFVDEDVRAKTQLDSVTTVVDAKHLPLGLADSKEAAEQIAFADQIILNKTDLVSEAELVEVERMIRRLNPLAPIHRAQRSNVPLDQVLGRGSFDLARIEEIEPDFLNPAHGELGHVHDDTCDHDRDEHAHHHHHHHSDDAHGPDHAGHDIEASGIRGISLTAHQPLNANKVTAWLNEVLQS